MFVSALFLLCGCVTEKNGTPQSIQKFGVEIDDSQKVLKDSDIQAIISETKSQKDIDTHILNISVLDASLGIFLQEGDEGTIHRYFSDDKDVRFKISIHESILSRMAEHGVKSLIMVEKIFGCPLEEGIDYPEGEPCPRCPFWNDRDRYSSLE